ncbi:translocation/assembly module TamB domain-containing protein [soil metagenome]
MDEKVTLHPTGKKKVSSRIANVLSYILVILFFIVVLALVLIQTAPVQNFARKKVQTYLQNKLHTRVEIGKINISFPNSVLLQDVYMEDQTKDTLLYGGELKVGIDMFRLLKNQISIREIYLDNITAKIKRTGNDTTFNFQYILDAFGNKTSSSAQKDTSGINMRIDRLLANKTRIVYKDEQTGDDMDFYFTHLDVPINKFDPAHQFYDIPSVTLSGLRGHYFQNQPLIEKIDSIIAEAVVSGNKSLQIKNQVITLNDIDVEYRSEPSDVSTVFKIQSLKAHPDTIDILHGKFALHDFTLSNSFIGIVMSNKRAPVTNKRIQQKSLLPQITLTSNKVDIINSDAQIFNKSMPVVNYGMDYGHLDLHNITLSADNFLMNSDSLGVSITSAKLNEKSGFVLNEFNGDFLLTDKTIVLQNFYIKTPGSILRKKAILTFPSIEKLAANPYLLNLDMDIESSAVLVKDILIFAPILRTNPAFQKPDDVWMLNGSVKGNLNDLHFQDFRFKGLTNTTMFITGNIRNMQNPKNFEADITFPYLNTTKTDVLSFLPKNTIPSTITLPETMSARGRVKGGTNNLYTDVTVSSSLGALSMKGTLSGFSNPANMKYNMAVGTHNLNLGVILQDKKTYGNVTSNFTVTGTGTDPMHSNISLRGKASSLVYNGYNYKNLHFKGGIINRQYNIDADIVDPNIDLTAHITGLYNGSNSGLHINADVDSIKLQALHFTPQPFQFSGKINGDLTNINPDQLAGNFFITNSVIVNNGSRFQLDSVKFVANNTNGNQFIRLQTPFMFAEINGVYKLTQIADILQQAIDPYFNTGKRNTAKVDAHDFTIHAKIFDDPALKAFIPDIKQLDSVTIDASISSTSGVNGTVTAPRIIMGNFDVANLNLKAKTENGQLNIASTFDRFNLGSKMVIYATQLNGSLANNNLNFNLNIKDKAGKTKYTLAGLLNQPTFNNYTFQLSPDNLMLNYGKWSINQNNSIQIVNGDLIANDFNLNKGSEQLRINSIGSGTNLPLSVDFANFSIATITGFFQTDSLMFNGLMNGNVLVKNYKTQPAVTTDLTINDFSINKDTLGIVTAKINNNIANVFNTDIRLTGRGNDLSITGNYYLKPENKSNFNFLIDAKRIDMHGLEGASMNAITNASGSLNGKIHVQGTLDNPNIDGTLNFDKTAFNVTMINSYFKVDNETIFVDNQGLLFDTFIIKDSADNELMIDGHIYTSNYFDYKFGLWVTADNFRVLNTDKRSNKLLYGKLVLTTDININGTLENPVVDGTLIVNEKTKFYVVLPQNETSVVDRKGIVNFINVDGKAEDSLWIQPLDSLNTSSLKGFDIAVNIEVDKNAEFNLIVDEGNGDFINAKGEGQLTAGIDPSGKVTLVGNYEMSQGSYELTFNFIKRRFDIQPGSRITWTGDPTDAEIDVSAVYIANASPIDLVQNQLSQATNVIRNTYRQKLPFQVWLTLKGQLMLPQIDFDIRLPEDRNYNVSKDIITTVNYRLTELKNEPSELNKQVFALILLNRFVNENPFDNSVSSFNAGAFARASVSKLLAEQLNNLASGLIQGVDINFDVVNTEDYTTGERRNRTDFNVGLSKKLLNDRLTVTVGSNFELEGPKQSNQGSNNIAGNVALDYKISRDGRYLLRFYRKNQYEGVVEGYIIETGLGFIMNVDYNAFSDIFKRSNSRKKKNATPEITGADDKQKGTE